MVSSLTDEASLTLMAQKKGISVERLASGCQVSIDIHPDGSYDVSCDNQGCDDECELVDSGGDPREAWCYCPGRPDSAAALSTGWSSPATVRWDVVLPSGFRMFVDNHMVAPAAVGSGAFVVFKWAGGTLATQGPLVVTGTTVQLQSEGSANVVADRMESSDGSLLLSGPELRSSRFLLHTNSEVKMNVASHRVEVMQR